MTKILVIVPSSFGFSLFVFVRFCVVLVNGIIIIIVAVAMILFVMVVPSTFKMFHHGSRYLPIATAKYDFGKFAVNFSQSRIARSF